MNITRNIKKFFLLIWAIPFAISGCGLHIENRTPTIHEYGCFLYIFQGENSFRQDINNKDVVIVGFTKYGLEQESIDVPKEMDGYPVKRIGISDEGYPGGNHSREVTCGEKLKKLYVFNTLESIELFDGSQVSLMVCSSISEPYRGSFVYYKNTYLYSELRDELDYGKSADVAFLNNYVREDNEKVHRIDNLNSENKIDLPPEPVREGYSFTGWYTEPECTNVWDFDVAPSIEGKQLCLYAGWNIQ